MDSAQIFRELINQLKVRLFDEKDKRERAELRRALRSLMSQMQRGVKIPTADDYAPSVEH